jgi:transcriptional regulator with XRE-family HTH domain
MTEATHPASVPQWTLGDRMRKAREHAGLKQAELAEEIGIGRSSVVNYESGRAVPSRPVMLAWSLAWVTLGIWAYVDVRAVMLLWAWR